VTATNHAITGVAIGLLIGAPAIALPVAFLSHFVCDAMPHFGFAETKTNNMQLLSSSKFRNYLIIEAITCILLVAGLAILQPIHWQLAAICAFIAASPDLLSANRYFSVVNKKKWKPNLYSRFAHDIQWFERPIGAVIELAWFSAALIVIMPFLG
jgi:hypothetical protein